MLGFLMFYWPENYIKNWILGMLLMIKLTKVKILMENLDNQTLFSIYTTFSKSYK